MNHIAAQTDHEVVFSDGAVTAEVARQQSDGTWLWVIDQFEIS